MVHYGTHGKKGEIFWNKISLTDYKCSNFNAPVSHTPCNNKFLRSSLFQLSATAPSCLPLSLPIIKKRFIVGGMVQRWKCFGTKSVKQATNVPIWMSQVRKPPWCHLLSAFQGQVVRRPFSISSEDALPSVAVPDAHHRGLDSVGASKDGYANFWFFISGRSYRWSMDHGHI